MVELLVDALKGVPKEAITLIIAALPVAELRGSIPVGLMLGLSPSKTFILSLIGNAIIVPPALLLLEPVSNALRRFPLWAKFFNWLFERTKTKGDLIQRYEALGLMLFVAIPLPITGAWTGCVAATLFKIKFRYAFPAILLGIITAGIIVLSVCLFGKGAYSIFVAR